MLQTIRLVFGFYPGKIYKRMRSLPWFFKSKREFIRLQKLSGDNDFKITKNMPCLLDRYEEGGTASGHYFHQDLLIAQQIFKSNPVRHVDIGSRVDGLVAHIASYREIEVFDIREITTKIKNVKFIQADFMKDDSRWNNYCDSLSCLHTIEHFGLGRYNDPLDPNGHIKGLDNMYKVLKKDGYFYFSVPIGPQRIEFNGHRIFSISYLLNYFKGKYELKSFSYVDDKGDLHRDVPLEKDIIENNCNCQYGCGIFILQKY